MLSVHFLTKLFSYKSNSQIAKQEMTIKYCKSEHTHFEDLDGKHDAAAVGLLHVSGHGADVVQPRHDEDEGHVGADLYHLRLVHPVTFRLLRTYAWARQTHRLLLTYAWARQR